MESLAQQRGGALVVAGGSQSFQTCQWQENVKIQDRCPLAELRGPVLWASLLASVTQIQPEMMDTRPQTAGIWGGLEMCQPLGRTQWDLGTVTCLGGDESGHLRAKGRSSASRDGLKHLGKASGNTGLFIIKSAKKIEWLEFRA